ncbi:cation diffusion facilitator family transporter [Phenylobacterium aquaticum]|uniref:cation diffusion facilitator family transporter n=1 Tax=Phenylobacterium aquaticum TaxID=1763816 RepID=UPI001F5CE26E|nr:cation diffusion facilitator family transporter [Phenylobacterium aquaticum]MCI3130767.1 cation diffusion facilitator family transporter [Phenylobacterium aquaticum]
MAQHQHGHDHADHADHAHEGHGDGGGHSHSHAPASFDRAFAIGVALNVGFVVIEATYGVIANSLALLADAGHNLSDVAGLLLAWGAVWLGRRAPTAKRTYGFGRTSILAALANAVLLLVAIGAIAWEAIRRFEAPQPVEGGTVMVVAAIGIVINTATALLFMRGRKGDINIRGAFLHMAADAGVSAGVVVAGLVITMTGWLWLDPVVSLVIVVVIALGTWGLLKDSVAMAIDAVPPGIDRDEVFAHLQGLEGVKEVHDLHIWPLSTTSTALTVHLVRSEDRIDDAFTATVTDALKDRFGIGHATIQFETGQVSCDLEPNHVV